MKTQILLLLLATVATTYGQEPAVIRRSVAQAGPPLENHSNSSPLDANYTLTIQGNVGDSTPLDVRLSGSGPRFRAVLADPTRSIEVIVSQKDTSFEVQYAIAAQIPVKVNETNIQYRDTSVTGNYLATLGQPFPVLKLGEKSLTIQIDKTVAKSN